MMALAVADPGRVPARPLACPNCKEAVSSRRARSPTRRAATTGACLHAVVPFSMLGTGAFMVRRAAKRGVFPEM